MAQMIHVGIIGLSADVSQGVAWAPSAHLPYLLRSPKYQIVALQNSSLASVQKAIEFYALPGKVKAYETPEELAADPSVDLVVSSIRVDRHGASVIPSIRAGKDIYVEWPLERNFEEAKKLQRLAQEHKVRSIAGLQSGFLPFAQKLKEIIESGRIGRVTSSFNTTYDSDFGALGRESVRYFADRETGGNLLTIHFGHGMEYMHTVLGDLKEFKSTLSVQYPIIDIKNRAGEIVEKGVARTSQDHVLFQGILESGAVFSYSLRGGPVFPGHPTVEWRIQGTKGEIRLTSDQMHIFLFHDAIKVEVFDYETNNVEEIKLEPPFMGLLAGGGGVALNYEKFWESKFGDPEKGKYKTFEDAIKLHGIIDKMEKAFDEQTQ